MKYNLPKLDPKYLNPKNIIAVVLIAVILLLQFKADDIANFLTNNGSYNYSTSVSINSHKLKVEIADQPQEIVDGLSNRPNLPHNSGMLFIFSKAQIVSFWMPYMNFPLDMIFIRDNKIVYIEKNVPNYPADFPLENLPTYSPNELVDMVLEVNAGWSDKNEIQIGDEINI